MIKLELPYPISANRYWRVYNNRAVRSREATQYKGMAVGIAAKNNHEQLQGDVSVALILHPKTTAQGGPSKTRIDLDNALKVTLDALNSIAYCDDKQIVHIDARIGEQKQGGGITVIVQDIATVITDTDRIDWLADVNNNIGNVTLPTECLHNNIEGGLRAAIDAAIVMDSTQL